MRSVLLTILSLVLFLPITASAKSPTNGAAALQPTESTSTVAGTVPASDAGWLEPRGLNIVDLVGLVPDECLRGAIVSYTPGYGVLTYESGSRTDQAVTIRTKVFPRYFESHSWSGSLFGCLGQPARIDQWGSVAPATTVRLYHGERDVTGEADLYSYVPAGRDLPVRNPAESQLENRYRYYHIGEDSRLPTSFTPDGALILPANMGCDLIMSHRNYQQLTAVFTAEVPRYLSVQVLGAEEFEFGSYLGVGYTGLLSNLVTQLKSRYNNRHPKFTLNVPQDANYFLLNFPAQPVDPYTQFPDNPYANVGRPTGGTYRVEDSTLSVDHVNAMGLPLYGHWRDKDLVDPSKEYLPHFTQPDRLAAPEYFVPDGVQFDPCMLSGTCPDALLEEIWHTTMTMSIVYLRLGRSAGGMEQIPLRMTGPGWDADSAVISSPSSSDGDASRDLFSLDGSSGPVASLDERIHLPLMMLYHWSNIPPDVPGSQPYGWFTEDGRMLGFIPRQ